MSREGNLVACCPVGQLMKLHGLRGAVRTTTSDTSALRPLDRVNRRFDLMRDALLKAELICCC